MDTTVVGLAADIECTRVVVGMTDFGRVATLPLVGITGVSGTHELVVTVGVFGTFSVAADNRFLCAFSVAEFVAEIPNAWIGTGARFVHVGAFSVVASVDGAFLPVVAAFWRMNALPVHDITRVGGTRVAVVAIFRSTDTLACHWITRSEHARVGTQTSHVGVNTCTVGSITRAENALVCAHGVTGFRSVRDNARSNAARVECARVGVVDRRQRGVFAISGARVTL
jgi:hypothetical protein